MKPKELGKCRRSDQFQTELNTIRKRGISIEVSFSRFSRIPIENEKKPFARKRKNKNVCLLRGGCCCRNEKKNISVCKEEQERERERQCLRVSEFLEFSER